MVFPVEIYESEKWQCLTKTERAIIWTLFSCSDMHGKNCFPSHSFLQVATGLGKNAVLRALMGLESKKAVKINKSVGKVNQYDLEIWTKPVPTKGTGKRENQSPEKVVPLKDTSTFSSIEPVPFADKTSTFCGDTNSINSINSSSSAPSASLSEEIKNQLKAWRVNSDDIAEFPVTEIQAKINLVLSRLKNGIEIKNLAGYFLEALRGNWIDEQAEKKKEIERRNQEHEKKLFHDREIIRQRAKEGKPVSQMEYSMLLPEDQAVLQVDESHYKNFHEWRYWLQKEAVAV